MGSKSRNTTTSLNNFKPLRQTLCWNRNRPGIHFSHSSSLGRMKSSNWWNKNNFTWAFQIPLQSFYWRTHLGKDEHSDHMPSALCCSLSCFPLFSSSIHAPVIRTSIFMYAVLSRHNSCLGEALLHYSLLKDKNECLGKGINIVYWSGKEELKSPAVLGLYSSLVTAASLPCS